MSNKIYKLARPLLRGVRVEITAQGVPQIVSGLDINGKGTRRYRDIPNRMVLDLLSNMPAFAGEVVVGAPYKSTCHDTTLTLLDDTNNIAPFVFWIYDMRTTRPFNLRERLEIAESMIHSCGPVFQYVDHETIDSVEALNKYGKQVVDNDFFPGVVLREPFGTFGTWDETIEADKWPEMSSLN